MAEKRDPSRRASDSRSAADRKAAARRNETESQSSHCRIDVIRCENCGEDYSVTYKRCPFCDERPGRGGIGGRRVAGDYRGPVHPVQVIGLAISLILIIAALFIVFKYVGPLIFGDRPGGGSSSPGASQSQSQSGSGGASQPGSASGGAGSDSAQSGAPAVAVTSLQLSKTDITLSADEEYQLIVTVTPADAEITWTSSDPGVLTVDEYGNVKNINSTSSLVKTTLTVSAGDKRVECTVYCKPSPSASGGGSGETPGSGTGTGTGTGTPSGTVAPNTPGTIINAGSGLNIRSGPGSSYEVVASASNGAKITVLEDSGTGWYKIDYGAGKTGYVSSSYVSIGN